MSALNAFFKPYRVRQLARKGLPSLRIIREFKRGGRVYQYHVTKGWRSYRAS
jgi:hypothetical protein